MRQSYCASIGNLPFIRNSEANGIHSRDIRLDILRCIALSCIVLAHVKGVWPWLFQLRNFDVPLIVLVSGAAYAFSASAKSESYGVYVRRRAARLVVPTWIFLAAFFAVAFTVRALGLADDAWDWKIVLDAFLIHEGFGYVWIIRVLLLMALIAPALRSWMMFTHGVAHFYYVGLLMLYGAYALAAAYLDTESWTGFLGIFMRDYVFYALPYGCVYGLGLSMPGMKRSTSLLISFCFAVALISQAYVMGHLYNADLGALDLQADKYPPGSYYLSYGLCVSFLIFACVHHVRALSAMGEVVVRFVSVRSMEIYLWHIFFVVGTERVAVLASLPAWFRFVIIMLVALASTYVRIRVSGTRVGMASPA